MKSGYLVKCIDATFTDQQRASIPNLPCKNTIYEVRKTLHTRMGKAILLYEIENPMVTDTVSGMQFEPSFNIRRFVIVDGDSGNQLREEIQELLCNEINMI